MNNKQSNGNKDHKSDDNDMAKKIAMGATGVVITAGVVAAGAVLADQKMRGKVGKSIQSGAKKAGQIASDIQETVKENYPAVSHRIQSEVEKRTNTGSKDSSRKASKKS